MISAGRLATQALKHACTRLRLALALKLAHRAATSSGSASGTPAAHTTNALLALGLAEALVATYLTPDLLEHLLSLEKLQDHNLSLRLVKVNLALCKLRLERLLFGVLLGNLPSAETTHQLRVVILFFDDNRTLLLEDVTKLVGNGILSLGLLLTLKLLLELTSLLHLLLTVCQSLLHEQLLTL